ncbi:efflux RND transporter permease subunit [Clostridium sp. B9]|uniref:efflux RND transporter permease subunit n=1 Tax=Clostridium sp. B9 TaxID=3423224 RepID=UPI003D2F0552
MKITSFSIKKPITIFMMLMMVMMFGVVSYFKLNVDMLPAFDLPMLMLMTQQPGAGPEEIEEGVTKPLEAVLSTVTNMDSIKSVSSEGSSMIMIQFQDGTDMDFAALDVREKVDMVKGFLPEEVMNPMIVKMNPSAMPIMTIGIGIEGYNLSSLSEWADDVLKPSLERVQGVASVDITGDLSDEVKIIIDQDKLNAYGLRVMNITSAIKASNMNMPIGNVGEGEYELLVRTTSKLNSIEEIKDIPINTPDGKILKLSEIADVKVENGALENYAKIDGKDALKVSIQKESTANTVKVSDGVNKAFEEVKASNKNLSAINIMDQAEFINFAIDSVKMNAVIGAFLAIIILLLFLKDIRATVIMAISIPISIISTFIMVYFGGLTLNMISLGGIALGVGMLVDNSIVVIENIYRFKKEGYSNTESAIKGTSEVAMAITASTLTSICVFLPIVFVQGMAADIFKEMALTVTFSLVSSLVVSFTIVPLLASRLLKENSLSKKNKSVEKLRDIYSEILAWSISHRKSVMGILLASILLGGVAFSAIGLEFFPSADQGIVMATIQGPKGIKLENLEEISNDFVSRLEGIEEIETKAVMSSGESSTVYLVLKDERKSSDKEIAREVRELTNNIPGAKIEINTQGSMMSVGGDPISLRVNGDDFKVLDEISEELKEIMEGVAGINNIKSTSDKNAEEIRLVIDKEAAAKYGLSPALIVQSVQGYFKGVNATTISLDGKRHGVLVYPTTSLNPSISDIEDITLINQRGAKIPLEDVATIERGQGYSEIYRTDQVREISLSAGVEGRVLGDVVKDIESKIAEYDIPLGYNISFGGEVEQMKDAFSQLFLALVLAIALVYMIMAAQFESLINPLIIMFTVPLAFVGALLALFIGNVAIGITAMIGFVMLTGIIVNNGIVLVDYINRLKKEGHSTREAIMIAGPTRLQPILMTALTTIMGLFPMALGIGDGSELQMPLALTVIGGLSFATILTLIVIPIVYLIFDNIKVKLNRKKSKSS